MVLTEPQMKLKQQAREFAKREIEPKAEEYDKSGDFPHDNVEKIFSQGYGGMILPKEYGGAGLDNISYNIVLEEISNACAATGCILAVHTSVGTYPIYEFGTPEQKDKYLPLLTSTCLGAFAVTEPGAGSDIKGIQTKARQDGNDFIMDGAKTFITNGTAAETVVVVARTNINSDNEFTAFIVESGMEGFSIGKVEDKMGIRASQAVELIFDSVRVPKDNILGRVGEGIKVALVSLDGGRVGIASQALGIAQAALEEAVSYSKQRIQFEKPISSFQAIQFKLADMATKIEAARHLIYYAASLKDQGQNYTKEAAMAKLFASEMAVGVVREALQIHGGHGYMRGSKVERLYRDVKITEIYEGTNEVQRMVIARKALK